MFNALQKHRKIGIRCYDSGGKTTDRYTVVYTGRYDHKANGYMYICMSERPFHPLGVGMHGDAPNYIDNRGYGQTGGYSHLGKPISFEELPKDCQKLVRSDVFDLAY